MGTIEKFEDLEIWKMARINYQQIINLSKKLKAAKEFRLSDQIKGSSGSVMDNIAEGFERNSRLEFVNSLSISKGENGEMRSQLYRCLDEDFLSPFEFEELINSAVNLSSKIANFIIYLNNSEVDGLKFKGRKKR